jgi:hypothetical protein
MHKWRSHFGRWLRIAPFIGQQPALLQRIDNILKHASGIALGQEPAVRGVRYL